MRKKPPTNAKHSRNHQVTRLHPPLCAASTGHAIFSYQVICYLLPNKSLQPHGDLHCNDLDALLILGLESYSDCQLPGSPPQHKAVQGQCEIKNLGTASESGQFKCSWWTGVRQACLQNSSDPMVSYTAG